MLKHSTFPHGKQRGFTLIEALISVVVLSFGLLAIGSFQAKLVASSGYNKARAEAIALAQDKLDEMRSYTTEHGLVENLTNTVVANPAAGAEFDFPVDVPAATTVYPTAAAESLPGTNATFSRRWNVTRSGELSTVVVTVSWTDRSGIQSVSLETDVSWRNPRGAADVGETPKPLVASPTGKAYLGDGSLTEQQMSDLKTNQPGTANNDGTYSADHDNDGDLELVVEGSDGTGEVVLTLPDACKLLDPITHLPICTDFVKISGTVFFDRTGGSSLDGDNIWVIASDAAYCSRWRPVSASATELTTSTQLSTDSGTSLLPGTDDEIYRDNNPSLDSFGNNDNTNDYEYFNYTCYLGGGWYGNIGLVMLGSNSQDFACVGDPNAGILDNWKQVELAKRRVYRGMLYKYTVDGSGNHIPVREDPNDDTTEIVWYSNGIKDATVLPDTTWAERRYGHDFVVSRGNSPTQADCTDVLTRPDADEVIGVSPAPSYPQMFYGMPDDFICLNEDGNNPAEGVDPRIGAFAKFVGYPWDYLNDFDETVFDAQTDCDYDPSDPPSTRYTIVGVLSMDSVTSSSWGSTNPAEATYDGNINTTDGFDNCTILSTTAGSGSNDISYSCDYYVWSTPDNQNNLIETPWNGSVVVNSPPGVVCTHDNPYDEAELSWQAVYDISAATGTQTANFVCHDLTEFTIQGTVTVDGGNDLGAIAGDLQFAAYDASDVLVADACQTTNASASSVDYICTGLLEQTYVSGFTGRVEMVVPSDYDCVSGGVSSTDASSTSCDPASVVTWTFTDFTADPATSTGNDVVLDGPIDQYKITGTIVNSTSPAQDLLTDMTVNTDPAGTCNWDIAANNKDVTYSCVVNHDTRLTATWDGVLKITPPNGFWCGTDTAGTSFDLSISGDHTASSAACVADTSGPITVHGSVYVPSSFSTTTWYENTPGTGTYDFVEFDYAGPNAGTHDYIEYEYVGTDSGSFTKAFDKVAYGTGSYVDVWHDYVGWGNGDIIVYPYRTVAAGTGSYKLVTAYDYVGDGNGDIVFTNWVTQAGGDYEIVTDPEFGDVYKFVGWGNGSYTWSSGSYVTPGTGNYTVTVAFVYVGSGGDYEASNSYDLSYTISASDTYKGNAVLRSSLGKQAIYYQNVGAGNGDYEPSDPAVYTEKGLGLGDYDPIAAPYYLDVGTGQGDYIQVNEYRPSAGVGDYTLMAQHSDLVTLAASMNGQSVDMTDGTCSFTSVPVLPDPPDPAGSSAQWYDFECTSNNDIMHNKTWSGGVTITTNAPWGTCQLSSYTNSYTGVAPQTLIDDAFSVVTDPLLCGDYSGSLTLTLPWTPTYTP